MSCCDAASVPPPIPLVTFETEAGSRMAASAAALLLGGDKNGKLLRVATSVSKPPAFMRANEMMERWTPAASSGRSPVHREESGVKGSTVTRK